MRRDLTIILAMILPAIALAQTPQPQWEKDSSRWVRKSPLAIYFEPLTFIDNFNLAFRFGMELPISSQFGVYLGGITSAGKWGRWAGPRLDSSPTGDWDGFGLRLGVKKYWRPANNEVRSPKFQKHWHKSALNLVEKRPYLGAELAYRTARYCGADSLVDIRQAISYDVVKETYTLSFTYGCTFTYRCGIFIQTFAGLGLRLKNSTNTLTRQQEDELYHWREGDVKRFSDGEFVNTLFPVLPLGIRIGYRFK